MTQTLTTAHYDVLNAVTVKKMASAGAVSAITGVPLDDVEAVMVALAADGLLVMVGDDALPTGEAATALAAAASRRYAALRADGEVLRQVDRFEDTNAQLLTAMTTWQTVDIGGTKVPNDHADQGYDDKVISRVDRLAQRLTPLLDALTRHDPRFGRYRQRFDEALAAVDEGRVEYVSSPTHDSVHTIWFQFHEDLLRTLGRERPE
jgi:hypothetical protein